MRIRAASRRRAPALALAISFAIAAASASLGAGGTGETSAAIAPSKRFLLAFHACEIALCSSPANHRVYLAESNDGAEWTMVPGWTTFAGSVPDVIQRGRTIYVYTASHQVARYNLDSGVSDRVSVSISGLPTSATDWVDPSLYVDDEGRLVLFFLYSPPSGGDPARCPSGSATCTKQFMSATEVAGSDGTQFAADSGDRATVTLPTASGSATASDPDIFYDGSQYVLYISTGNSISVWTSSTLRGTYTPSTALSGGMLSVNGGGVPAGYFDSATSRYWTFAHSAQGAASAIRRAVHANLTSALSESNWTTVATGTGLGLGSSVGIESPSFATLTTATAPSPPSNLAYTLSGTTISLTWTAAAGATSYDVEVGSRSGASDVGTYSTSSASLSGSAASGTYYVRVRARNSAGTSGASNEVAVTVGGCAVPGAPATLAATVSGGTVLLTWVAVSGATSYVLEAGFSPGATNAANSNTGSTATTLTASAPRGTYYVRVKAKNSCGTSAASNEIVVVVS